MPTEVEQLQTEKKLVFHKRERRVPHWTLGNTLINICGNLQEWVFN